MNTFLIKFEIFTLLAGSSQVFDTTGDLLASIDEVYYHLIEGIDMDEFGVTSEPIVGKFKGMN
jgi:hypothetical protein